MSKNENNQTSRTVAVVTGANRGIGAQVSRQLARQGIHVVVTARQLHQAQQLVDEIVSEGGSAEGFCLDVSSTQNAHALCEHLRQHHGRLDILVNNAGIALDQWMSGFDVSLEVMEQTFSTNVIGVLNCCQQLMPLMREGGYGRVVNVSTELASLTGMELGSTVAYRTSKAALNALTKLLSLELKDEQDILINAACPGWVKTDLGGDQAPRTVAEGADTIVWLATLPAGAGSGGLYRDREPYPW